MGIVPIAVIVFVALVLLTQVIKVLNEYERGVVFTFGRFTGVKGPGLIILVPAVQRMVKVDLRVVVLDVPTGRDLARQRLRQGQRRRYFRVVDPERAIIQVSNYLAATSQLAQTTLRWVLGKHDLDQMLAERDKLNADIQDVLDKQTEGWGIKVSTVELKRIDLDESMVRAIARQAEAERERRAKIINAEGEQQAAQKLVEAARILAAVPQAMQLRYLGTLFDIASERGSTIVFPFPIELVHAFGAMAPRS
jgi:regulator of protease activity HflC (stomatin/prohibitin superfamily)